MTESPTPEPAEQQLSQALKNSGLFDQLQKLEASLGGLANDLSTLGRAAVERSQETESLAAHVLALEAIVTGLLQAYPVPPKIVADHVNQRTRNLSPEGKGFEQVQGIVDAVYSRAGVTEETFRPDHGGA